MLAPDLRGHSRGLPRAGSTSRTAPTTLPRSAERCAGPVLAVGYSMGGPVAQLLWHQHPDLVSGLVLCATSDSFAFGLTERRAVQRALGALASGAHVAETALKVPSGALAP